MKHIWDIIPQLTLPLPVLSFMVYLFFLAKRSEDRKKEKSLMVGDKDTKSKAALKILEDHPEITINPISDPRGKVEIAKEIIQSKLKRHSKTANTLLFLSLIFALTYLGSLALASQKKMGKNEGVTEADPCSDATLLALRQYEQTKKEITDKLQNILVFSQYSDSANIMVYIRKFQDEIVDLHYQQFEAKVSDKECARNFRLKLNSLVDRDITTSVTPLFEISSALNEIISYPLDDFDTFLDRYLYQDENSRLPHVDVNTKIIQYRIVNQKKQGFLTPGSFKYALSELRMDASPVLVVRYTKDHAGNIDTLFVRTKQVSL